MFVTLALAVYAVKPDARVELPAVAATLPHYPPGDVVYNRLESRHAVAAGDHLRLLERATDPRFDLAALMALLEDPRPKVRTLAAAAMYAREAPALLPALVPLAADPADTFPAVRMSATPRFDNRPPPTNPQTVADCVRPLLLAYIGEDRRPLPERFAAYWAARKDRPQCASWFRVALMRASGGIGPTQADRVPAIRAVRGRIDRVPEPDRTLTLLNLANEQGGDALATEAELLAGCKAVGRDRLLRLLRREPISDDPDLRPRPEGVSEYGSSPRRFVLRHAAALLRPEDADTLAELGRVEGSGTLFYRYRSPDWAIAAADLRPDRAKQFLTTAWPEFQREYDEDHRTSLALARWRRGVDGGTAFTTDWFYGPPLRQYSIGVEQVRFLDSLADPAADQRLVIALVRDTRLPGLGFQAMQALTRRVNAWSKTFVVSDKEMQRAWHPHGESHFDWQRAEATAKYPKETAILLAELETWRTALRAWADKQ